MIKLKREIKYIYYDGAGSEYYFLRARCIILVKYLIFNNRLSAESHQRWMFWLALFFCIIVLRDFFAKRVSRLQCLPMAVIIIYMIFMYSDALLMLYIIFVYEIMSFLNFGFMSCLIPAAMACIPSSVGDVYSNIVFTVLIGIIYIQHYYVVASYRSQKNDDLAAEQRLKKIF